jgi:GNAT superfamily N-acetyltransferase
MVQATSIIKASLDAGREFFTPPRSNGEAANGVPYLVPIRSLGPGHRERIAAHILALDEQDRYLRFGYIATDEQIQRYVDKLDFDRDEIFGIYNRKLELVAMAHLAFAAQPNCTHCAEFGVSVAKSVRGRGYGSRLFERAVMHARNEGVDMLFIHALTENTAMLKIAQKAGALVEHDGSETEAHLMLPPADMETRVTEFIEEQVAQTDFHLKTQAKLFWEFLHGVQALRRGMQEARDKMRE